MSELDSVVGDSHVTGGISETSSIVIVNGNQAGSDVDSISTSSFKDDPPVIVGMGKAFANKLLLRVDI